ncbi:MFS general substrate transporter [Trametes coccinea BRFM310]|uniref:MFS general substrate transporter n=1 Tax=Trametes coccinea (strain BRFM310) TaxID=1353009 RepID=A0A1Y2IF48_TRAC3|nr:MFS general substrate transporter [Trametes coccinea BRFM310]
MPDSVIPSRTINEGSPKAEIDIECLSLQKPATASSAGISDSDSPAMNSDETRRLWRRVDSRLIPLVTVMYLVAFIDKTNIGNAKIQGLTTQLNLTGNRFNIILTLNFVANCVFALPANLLLKRLRPSVWLPGITIVWGVITTLQGVVKSYQQLLALRICLGIAEAGLSPGILYYLTLWYPRYMLQYRIGLFWGGAAFAGAFSGLLAYGISFMAGTRGLEGWSWVFILEGILSIIVGVIAAFLFVDYPQTANFLKPKEKAYLIYRTTYDTLSAGEDPDFDIKYVLDALRDWQVWVGCLIEMSIITPVYGISLFLPSIINGFGFGPAISQLLSVPPYVIATAMVVLWATWSDRVRRRSPFVMLGLALCLIGFSVNISNVSIGAKYSGTFLIVIGGYAGFPAIPSWLGNNLAGHYKRGTGMAVQAISGQVGGIIASNIYRTQDAPRYTTGHIVELAFIALGLVLVPVVVLVYTRINSRRAEGQEKAFGEGIPEDFRRMGDRAPEFRYTI